MVGKEFPQEKSRQEKSIKYLEKEEKTAKKSIDFDDQVSLEKNEEPENKRKDTKADSQDSCLEAELIKQLEKCDKNRERSEGSGEKFEIENLVSQQKRKNTKEFEKEISSKLKFIDQIAKDNRCLEKFIDVEDGMYRAKNSDDISITVQEEIERKASELSNDLSKESPQLSIINDHEGIKKAKSYTSLDGDCCGSDTKSENKYIKRLFPPAIQGFERSLSARILIENDGNNKSFEIRRDNREFVNLLDKINKNCPAIDIQALLGTDEEALLKEIVECIKNRDLSPGSSETQRKMTEFHKKLQKAQENMTSLHSLILPKDTERDTSSIDISPKSSTMHPSQDLRRSSSLKKSPFQRDSSRGRTIEPIQPTSSIDLQDLKMERQNSNMFKTTNSESSEDDKVSFTPILGVSVTSMNMTSRKDLDLKENIGDIESINNLGEKRNVMENRAASMTSDEISKTEEFENKENILETRTKNEEDNKEMDNRIAITDSKDITNIEEEKGDTLKVLNQPDRIKAGEFETRVGSPNFFIGSPAFAYGRASPALKDSSVEGITHNPNSGASPFIVSSELNNNAIKEDKTEATSTSEVRLNPATLLSELLSFKSHKKTTEDPIISNVEPSYDTKLGSPSSLPSQTLQEKVISESPRGNHNRMRNVSFGLPPILQEMSSKQSSNNNNNNNNTSSQRSEVANVLSLFQFDPSTVIQESIESSSVDNNIIFPKAEVVNALSTLQFRPPPPFLQEIKAKNNDNKDDLSKAEVINALSTLQFRPPPPFLQDIKTKNSDNDNTSSSKIEVVNALDALQFRPLPSFLQEIKAKNSDSNDTNLSKSEIANALSLLQFRPPLGFVRSEIVPVGVSGTDSKKKLKPVFIEKLNPDTFKETIYGQISEKEHPSVCFADIHDLFENAPISKPALSLQQQSPKKEVKTVISDPRRSQNLSIMVMKFRKVTMPELRVAIVNLDPNIITLDACSALLPFCPTPEEAKACQASKEPFEKLDTASQFFMSVYDIPRLRQRFHFTIFKAEFKDRLDVIVENINKVKIGCDRLRENTHFRIFLKLSLDVANTLNEGTARGAALGLKPASLMSFESVRSNKPGLTLLVYIVKKINEQKPEILDFTNDFEVMNEAIKVNIEDPLRNLAEIQNEIKQLKLQLDSSVQQEPQDTGFIIAFKEFHDTVVASLNDKEAKGNSIKQHYVETAKFLGEDDDSLKKKTSIDFFKVFKHMSDTVKKFKTEDEERKKREARKAGLKNLTHSLHEQTKKL